jgi:TRAP-type mannitol/chloroaromatic compound transport system permease small subunit
MVDRLAGWLVGACGRIAAFWAMLLGFIILYDIVGREAFDSPLRGTVELVANSIVSILFLQIPYAIYTGAHFRTVMIYQHLGSIGQRLIDVAAYLLGIIFFVSLVLGGWGDMVTAWRVGEWEGEGALRVPTYPVRTLIIAFAALSAAIYVLLLVHTLAGRREDGSAYGKTTP